MKHIQLLSLVLFLVLGANKEVNAQNSQLSGGVAKANTLDTKLSSIAPEDYDKYGLGFIPHNGDIQDINYLNIPSAGFLRPQYSGTIDSDKYLFENAVSVWINAYPAEYQIYFAKYQEEIRW